MAELRRPERQKGVAASPASARYREALEIASRNLKTLFDAGVPIAMGTDTGPPARFQGYFEHLELERMVAAGLTPAQVLRHRDRRSRALPRPRREGRHARAGAWADLLVLREDPLADIRHTRTLESVWIAGNRCRRASPPVTARRGVRAPPVRGASPRSR